MSNCYPIAGVISLKPLTGAQGGPSYCIYRAPCWAFLHTWLLSHPVKTQIICPRSYLAGIEPQVHLTRFYFPQTKNHEKPDLAFCDERVEAEILEVHCISQLYHPCGVAESHPSVRICNHCCWFLRQTRLYFSRNGCLCTHEEWVQQATISGQF